MQYPLTMNFKILALAPQIYVRDANGQDLMYVKQKLFKLKEDIRVFSDKSQDQQIYSIKADRIIDFSARYSFKNDQDISLGSVRRKGMRSLWKASYDIMEGENIIYHISEENAFVKLMDAIFGQIPILGIFTGYFFHPSYLIQRMGGSETTVMKFTKKPSFFESNFIIEKITPDLSQKDEELILLSILTATLLERRRG